jgi:hypothetical protein
MHGRKHIHRIAALLTAVAALAFFAGSVQAANSRPAGMTKAAYRALMLRSEALNRQYGLGSGALLATSAVAASDALTPKAIHALGARYEAMAQYYAGASSSLPPQAAQALGERYEAMAEYYLGPGSSGYTPPQALRALGERWQAVARYEQQAQLEQARRQAAAFSWADAGIGALAAIGAVALLGLGALGLRSRTPGRPARPAAS